jgi:hypothetical protein
MTHWIHLFVFAFMNEAIRNGRYTGVR